MDTKTSNLRGSEEFKKLFEIISHHSQSYELIYCPSPGNWGDALINHGTDQFFDAFDLPRIELTRTEIVDLVSQDHSYGNERVLLVGGGGGWCENWSSTRTFVLDTAPYFHQIIILPTTFELPLICDFTNIIYFSRGALPRTSAHTNTFFCHDMAFFIDLIAPVQIPKLWRLIAFRGDREKSTDSFAHPQQIDISLLGNSFSSIYPLFEIVNRFNVVYTDRLHVGIAASLLGIDCFIMPGNYDKSIDVWSFSIKDNYRNTRLLSWNKAKELLPI